MLRSMGSQSDSVTEQHQQYRTPHLGRGEDSEVSGKLVCDRGQDLMWLGQSGRQGEWRQRQRGVLRPAGLPGLGEMARR